MLGNPRRKAACLIALLVLSARECAQKSIPPQARVLAVSAGDACRLRRVATQRAPVPPPSDQSTANVVTAAGPDGLAMTLRGGGRRSRPAAPLYKGNKTAVSGADAAAAVLPAQSPGQDCAQTRRPTRGHASALDPNAQDAIVPEPARGRRRRGRPNPGLVSASRTGGAVASDEGPSAPARGNPARRASGGRSAKKGIGRDGREGSASAATASATREETRHAGATKERLRGKRGPRTHSAAREWSIDGSGEEAILGADPGKAPVSAGAAGARVSRDGGDSQVRGRKGSGGGRQRGRQNPTAVQESSRSMAGEGISDKTTRVLETPAPKDKRVSFKDVSPLVAGQQHTNLFLYTPQSPRTPTDTGTDSDDSDTKSPDSPVHVRLCGGWWPMLG